MVDYVEFSENEDKANLFRGRILGRFLKVEENIENIITGFFYNSEHENKDYDFLPFVQMSNLNAKYHNMERKLFYEYFFHPHLNITTKLKIDFLSVIIQLRSPDYFKELNSVKFGNIFSLINELNNFRNAIAHKVAYFEDGNLIIGKKLAKFNTTTTVELKNGGAKEVKYKSYFVPINEYYKISKFQENIIHAQIDIVNIFLKNYNGEYLENHPKDEKLCDLINDTFNSEDLFGKKAGVFGALKTEEQKIVPKPDKERKERKEAKTKEQNANKAKKQSQKE